MMGGCCAKATSSSFVHIFVHIDYKDILSFLLGKYPLGILGPRWIHSQSRKRNLEGVLLRCITKVWLLLLIHVLIGT